MFKYIITTMVLILLISGCAQVSKKVQPIKPEIVVRLSTTTIEPGHAIKISVQGQQDNLEIQVQGWWPGKLSLQQSKEEPHRYIRYVTTPLDMDPGNYSLTIMARSPAYEEETIHSYSITVNPRSPFKISRLSIKSFGKYDFASESRLMSEARKKAGFINGPEINSFIWPVKGRLSGQFGSKRIYNGGVKSWYHGGLDIAAPGGTIIVAPADGEVILSQDFTAHGKTIIIDHGFGVITTYLHQKKRLVAVDELVKQGQPIGQVGTTGSSTGNHLHFQVNINNVISNPYDFLPSNISKTTK